TAEQRMKLLDVHLPNRFLRNSAAWLGAAAAIALAFFTKEAWLPQVAVARVAKVSTQVTSSVQQAAGSVAEGEDFISQLANFRKNLNGEPTKWLPSQAPAGANVMGPPSSLMNVEVGSRSGLEFGQ